MKVLRVHLMNMFLVALGASMAASALAAEPEPVPIGADAAFDAVTTQTDPDTGYQKAVALVDVRSRAEYFWVGTATQVDEIILKDGSSITPDLGKVILDHEGKFLTYTVDGRNKRIQVKKVAELVHSAIARSIPFKLWNEDTAKLEENGDFATEIAELVQEGIEVVILYCRSGGRSTDCIDEFDPDTFDSFFAVYEIDDPAGNRGFGGFEGNSYKNVYNGYRGFPARQTDVQTVPSVSWKDSGLPMKTSINPLQ